MQYQNIKNLIEKLTTQIIHHNYLYHQKGVSEISDYEFDKLVDELTKLEKKFPEFRLPNSPIMQVGERVSKNFTVVNHSYPMLSLSNTYSKDEVLKFYNRTCRTLQTNQIEFFCELKFDGIAISLKYTNGILKRIATRGNGFVGDDITENASKISSIPQNITLNDIPAEFEVRGEAFMPTEQFRIYNEEREALGEPKLANPRNAVAGTLKLLNSNIVEQRVLDCYVYSLRIKDKIIHTHEESIKMLEQWNFNVSNTYAKCKNIDEVFDYIEIWETKRSTLPVNIDGIVIKVNSMQYQELLGNTTHSPRWAVAFKYKPENTTTILESITYQVGRTGAVTPVANFKPVLLAGTIVKRASLHNAGIMQNLDLHLYDTVFVEKGGEVIPQITGIDIAKRPPNSIPIKFIEICPECNTKLVKNLDEAIHYCPNQQICTTQIKGRVKHFVSRDAMNIELLGDRTIDFLFEKSLLRTPDDIYKLKYSDIYNLDGFKETSTKNLLQGIINSKQRPFKKVLFALGIRHVGETVAERLANHFKSIDELFSATTDTLILIPEIGKKISESIVAFFSNPLNLKIIDSLKFHGLNLKNNEYTKNSSVPNTKFNGKNFVISGSFALYSRVELEDKIKQLGGKVLSSVSKNTDYLLIGDNPGKSKLESAINLNVTTLKELDFTTVVKNSSQRISKT